MLPVPPNTIGHSEGSWGTTTVWTPRAGSLTREASQQTIRKAGSSTTQRPDGLTVLYLRHLGEYCLAFQLEFFNLSVAWVDTPAIWIPIFGGREATWPGSLLPPISLLCQAVMILEQLLLPSIVEALGTRPSQHSFKLRHFTTSALLPTSARVVSCFILHKPPSKTIDIAVGFSKAFDTVSHRLLIEMIHCF